MPNLFSDSVIDEIRDKCNIAEIISGYIPLKRAGRNFRALCPFHQEKTPSFMVSPHKRIFHCFGCGCGGNVFNFVMKYEGLEFPQVVRMLAKRVGVTLPAASLFVRQERESYNLFRINELAASWFAQNLKRKEGQPALQYLKRRSFCVKTILQFRLGFASANNTLLNFMLQKEIKKEDLEKAGLISRKDSGIYYDRFRQKLIFPIFDVRSRILGFGARVLDNSLPKYVNSPQTPIYNKGSHLYGLNFTKEEIRKHDFCIIVEGYIDLLTACQSGIGNIAASLGTALTPEQIRLLKRYTSNVVVVFDADRAGESASLRSLDLLIEEDINVKVVSLPAGYDPDSFIVKFGRERFQEKVNQAAELFDYKLNLLGKTHKLTTVEGQVAIAAQMLPTIRRIKNAIRRGAYVRRLAQEFSRGERFLGEEWILAELKKLRKDIRDYSRTGPAQIKVLCAPPAEEMLLKILLHEEHPETIKEMKRHLLPEDFQDLRIRETIRVVYRTHDQGKEIKADKLISALENQDTASLIARICSRTEKIIDCQKSLRDCIRKVKTDNLQNRLSRLQREIKLAQGWGHKEKITELVGQYNQLIKFKNKV